MTTGEEIHLDIPEEAEFYKTFLDPQNMDHAVEITFAALIQALLSLKDVFQENKGNYGITTDNRFLFIDHLPGVNGPFNDEDEDVAETYSPRTHLEFLFEANRKSSNLLNLKLRYNRQFSNEELNRRVNERLFHGIGEKFLSLEKAIDQAKKDLISIIREKENYFITNARERLLNYIGEKLIGKNLTHYKESTYYNRYLRSIDNLSKPSISSQNVDNEKDCSSEEQEKIIEKN